MEDSSVIDGKVYAFHVKVTEKLDWSSNDIAYGVVYQGNDGLAFSQFKYISENLNKKKFLSKRANTISDDTCTWVEVTSTLETWEKVGEPDIVHVDPPITFYDLARALYNKGLFTNPDGLARLDKIAKARNSSSEPDSSHLSGKISSARVMIEQAKNTSASIKASISSAVIDAMSQAGRQLAGLHNHPQFAGQLVDNVPDNPGDADDDVNATIDKLKNKLEEYKGRLAAAEEQFAAQSVVIARKDTELANLQNTLDQTKSDLAVARSAQASFMAESDKTAIENKKLTDGTTMDIVNGLKPFLKQEFASFVSALDPTSSTVSALKDTCDNVSKSVASLVDTVPKSFNIIDSQLVAMMETTSDGLESVANKLEKLDDSFPSTSSPSPPSPTAVDKPVHPGPCNYQMDDNLPGTLTCTLGCGGSLRVAGSGTIAPTSGVDFSVPPPSNPSVSSFQPITSSTPIKYNFQQKKNLGVSAGGITKPKNNPKKIVTNLVQHQSQQNTRWKLVQQQDQASFPQYQANPPQNIPQYQMMQPQSLNHAQSVPPQHPNVPQGFQLVYSTQPGQVTQPFPQQSYSQHH